MIRKVIIITLTTLAVGTGVMWLGLLGQRNAAISHPWDRPPVEIRRGQLVVCCKDEQFETHSQLDLQRYGDPMVFSPATHTTERLGFSYNRWEDRGNFYYGKDFVTVSWTRWNATWVTVPLWALFLISSTYPALALMCGPLRRYRRRKRGLCLTCGYNLTGNVSGRCPECGETV